MVDFFTKLHSAELVQEKLWHVDKTGVLTPPGSEEPGEIDLCAADPTTCPQRAAGAMSRDGMAVSLAMLAVLVVSLFLGA